MKRVTLIVSSGLKMSLTLMFCLVINFSYAQNWDGELELQSGFTTNKSVPFWLRSNQFGVEPLDGLSGITTVRVKRKYNQVDSIIWKPDFSIGIQGRINVGHRLTGQLFEAKASLKYGFMELLLGREKEYSGLVDSTLSSGSFSLSGNSLGIPKLEVKIPRYINIPLTNQLLAVRGNFSLGTMGQVPIHYGENKGTRVNAYYHHLSFYGRFGRPNWKLKFEGAINHDVIWGSDKYIFGDQYDLKPLEALWYVFTGKTYWGAKGYNGAVDISKIGNHLGSLDVAISYDIESLQIKLYHQLFYDKGALRYLANIRDGLTGLVIKNKKSESSSLFYWDKFLLEFFNSRDQGGQFGAPWTPSGPEYYYNHGVYGEGYSYKGKGIGSPLIVPAKDARQGFAHNPKDFFVSTRVSALHAGFVGKISGWDVLTKFTFSRHFGDYHTSGPSEQWFKGERIAQDFSYGLFEPVNQFSYYVVGSKKMGKKFNLSFTLAGDKGRLFENSTGVYLGITRKL